MKRFMVADKFDNFKKAFKKQWNKIGSDELDSMLDIKTTEEDVILTLSERYEKTKEEIKQDFHEWLDRIEDKKDEDVEEILEEIKDIEEHPSQKSKVDQIVKKIDEIEAHIPKKDK